MVNQRSVSTTSTTSRNRPTPAATGHGDQSVQQVSDTARETVSKATETARQQADSQLTRIGSGLERVAESLQETGSSLRQNDQAAVAGYVEQVADQVQRASGYLRSSSVNDILEDVQSYARREPLVAVGVAVGVGFLAARLLKASLGSQAGSRDGQTMAYRTRAYSPSPRYGNGA